MKKHYGLLVGCFLLLPVNLLQADAFRDGVVAYQQQKYQQALDIWLPLAEAGHVLAQTLVGSMYAYGEGVPENNVEAFKWFSKAAHSGSAQAQYNLAILYEKGFGTTKDTNQARKWYKAAADQGRKDAAARLILLDDDTQVIAPKTNASTSPIPDDNNTLLGPPDNIEYGADWVRQQPPDNYTIQLAASIEPRLIDAFKKQIKLSRHYADTQSTQHGKQWHAVIYGSYNTVAEANQAIAAFPDSWKTWRPWIKKFSTIKHVKE